MADADPYVAHLQRVTEITERIRSTALAEDWDSMLGHLEERQTLMSQIDVLAPAARLLTGTDRAVATRLLENLAQQDQEITLKVTAAMAATKLAAEENELTRTTVSAYRRAANPAVQPSPARFVDKHR